MLNDGIVNVLRGLITQTVGGINIADIVFGEVISVSPLVISISQKENIDEDFLLLTDSVRDYYLDIEVNHTTETKGGGGGYAEFATHSHGYKGVKKIKVLNGLKVGEQVVMIKQTGGQMFVVLCRIFEHKELQGQWR